MKKLTEEEIKKYNIHGSGELAEKYNAAIDRIDMLNHLVNEFDRLCGSYYSAMRKLQEERANGVSVEK